MDDVYVYLADLPQSVSEIVTPCADGYTIYLNDRLCPAKMRAAYYHAMEHIEGCDFERRDVQEIEMKAHDMQ